MNDKTLTPALARRLAAYSATVGVALAAAPAASGQIVFHDYEPDLHSSFKANLDFDDDGVVDLVLNETSIYPGRGQSYRVSFRVPVGGNPMNGLLGYDGPYSPDPNVGALSRLPAGAVVEPAVPPQGFYRTGVPVLYTYPGGNTVYPFANREGLAGFRFVAGDGALHYGWMRVRGFTLVARILKYGYESAPDTPITVGAHSDITLDGLVNQTTFPPSGGILTYTVKLTNTTDEPAPYDLWVDADLNGADAFTRKLGSGNLAPGDFTTRRFSVPVPAGAAPGTYDVKFKVGDFDTRAFITFESFTITKSATYQSDEGGDVLAEAALSLPGTHALSDAAPNPSSGHTAFTLDVAESQSVRVAVYNALGQQVALLYDGVLAAGTPHRLVLAADGLATGVYVLRAVGATFSDVRTFTLTR